MSFMSSSYTVTWPVLSEQQASELSSAALSLAGLAAVASSKFVTPFLTPRRLKDSKSSSTASSHQLSISLPLSFPQALFAPVCVCVPRRPLLQMISLTHSHTGLFVGLRSMIKDESLVHVSAGSPRKLYCMKKLSTQLLQLSAVKILLMKSID